MEPMNIEALFPDRRSSEPLGRQLIRRLRAAIESGVFKPSTRLLPSRELAARLGLARNTVTAAINQLIAEGYLEARVGSGTFVAPIAVMSHQPAAPYARSLPLRASGALALKPAVEQFRNQTGALRSGDPASDTFPVAVWQRLMRASLSSFDRLRGLWSRVRAPCAPRSRRLAPAPVSRHRGGRAAHDHRRGNAGGAGVDHRRDAAPGDAVVVEDPCYPLARDVFRLRLLRLAPVRRRRRRAAKRTCARGRFRVCHAIAPVSAGQHHELGAASRRSWHGPRSTSAVRDRRRLR